MTKVIEVYEEEQVEEDKLTVEAEEDDTNQLMIWIPAAVVGLLILVAVVMIIRVCVSKKTVQDRETITQLEKVKTEVVDVEPQFVLDNDQSVNIFARSSQAMVIGADAIERSEIEKVVRGDESTVVKKKVKKVKKVIIRKKKQNQADATQAAAEAAADNSDIDDGFGDNRGINLTPAASHTSSFNSSQRKPFMQSSRDSTSTVRKLKTIALHRVNDDVSERD